MKFCGWVPTVTGHLSFSTIGNATHPQKCLSLRCNADAIFYQNRDLLDVIIPLVDGSPAGSFFQELVANYVIGQSGVFSFVASASTSDSGEKLTGELFLLSRKLAKNETTKIKKIIGTRNLPDEDFSEALGEINSTCREQASASATYSLERGGRFEIEITDPEGEISPEICKILANQFFYFFKDISHVHQHHDPKLDAITEVHPITSEDDESWRHHTVSSLYRAIIRFKRFRRERSLFRASGILAYSKSFESRYPTNGDDRRTFHSEELEKSLSVARDEIKHFDSKRISQIETMKGFFFALFGFVISGALLSRLSLKSGQGIKVHESILWATERVAQTPYETIALIGFIAYVYQFFTHRKDPAEIRVIRTLFSLLQGIRLRWHVVVNALITILSCLAAYYLLVVLNF